MNSVQKSRSTIEKNLRAVNKACDYEVEKAEEGQTKVIFGKPYTYSGGKWVQDDSPTSATDDAPDVVSSGDLEEAQSMGDIDDDEAFDLASELEEYGVDPSNMDVSTMREALSSMQSAEDDDDEVDWEDDDYGTETEVQLKDRLSSQYSDAFNRYEDQVAEGVDPDTAEDNFWDMIQDEVSDEEADMISAIMDDITMNYEDDEISWDETEETEVQQLQRMIEEGTIDPVTAETRINELMDAPTDKEPEEMTEEDWANWAEEEKQRQIKTIESLTPEQQERAKELGYKSSNTNKSRSVIRKNLAGVYDALKPHGITLTTDNHSHSYLIDRDGNGATTGMIGEYSVDHIHDISNFEVKSAQNHMHEMLR